MSLRGHLFVFLAICFKPWMAVAQTRIAPPQLSLYQTESTDVGPFIQTQSQELESQIPVPLMLIFAMPFVDVSGWRESSFVHGLNSSSYSSSQGRVGIGLLHHAEEGAPLWKGVIGYTAGSSDSPDRIRFNATQHRYGDVRFDLNLEKLFPSLRPRLTDRVFAWVGITAFSSLNQNFGQLVLPELGWEVSREHVSFRIIVPREARIRWVLRQPDLSTSLEIGQNSRLLTLCSKSSLKKCLHLEQFARVSLDWRFYEHMELSLFGGGLRNPGASSNRSLIGVRIAWDPYWSYTP